MDPNANLIEQVQLAESLVEAENESADANRLAELVLALNLWILRGGFLPKSWERKHTENPTPAPTPAPITTRHRVILRTVCPVNGDQDTYTVDVFPTKLMYCETVKAATDRLQGCVLLQEQLTQHLADVLGCRVRTRGDHRGVSLTVNAYPK